MLNPSTLVFILGTKILSLPDVPNSSGRKIEDRGRTSSVQRFGRPTVGDMTPLGYALVGTLLSLGLYEALNHGESNGGSSRRATQPTSPSEPNNSPRAYVGREERNRSRGLRRTPAVRCIQTYI